MRRIRWLTLASLGVFGALGCRPPDAALKVTVTLKAQGTNKVRADCVKLAVLDGDVEKKSVVIRRQTDDVMVFAVLRGTDLPKNVNLQVSGLLGDCMDESSLRLNAQGMPQATQFPESGVASFDLELEPPNSTLDADRDGFVGAMRGGPDCADNDSTIFPGGRQLCTSTVDTDCNGSVSCDDPGCSSDIFCADQADRVVLTTQLTPTMLRGDCFGPIRVELRSATGPRTAVRDTPVTFTSSITGMTTHATATCNDMPITSLPILFDTTFVEVYLKADEQAFGTNNFTATAAQVAMPGSLMVEVHPRAVAALRFTNTPLTIGAGGCSAMPLTLQFFDSQNRPTDVDAPSTINLSSTPNDVMNRNIFFSDATCLTPSPTVMLMPGRGTANVYVQVQRAATFNLVAAPSVGTSDMQNLIVNASTPTQLSFANMPLALIATNPCSQSPIILQLEDEFGNPSTLPTALPLNLSVSGPSSVSFFAATDTNCAMGAIMMHEIPANTSELRLNVGSSQVGTNTINASSAVMVPPIAGDMQDVVITAGQASRFTWLGQPQTAQAGVCSAAPLTIQLRDSTDSPAASMTSQGFLLSTVPALDPSFHFYSGAGCVNDINFSAVIPAGQLSTTIYFRGNRAVSSFEIRASGALMLPPTQSPGHSIVANVPGKLTFGAPTSQTAQAGNCSASPYVVNVLDTFDNPTSFNATQTVTVTSNPAGVTIGPAGMCSVGNSVNLAAGMQTANFTTRHTVTTPMTPYQLTATVAGFSTAMPATFNVTPGNPVLQVDNPLNGTTTMTAGNCQNVTLTRRDGFMNNAPTSGNNNVTLNFPPSTNWDVYLGANCSGAAGGTVTMNSTHTTSFSLRPRTSGMHMVQASVAGTMASINFTVNPGMPTLVFEQPNTGMPGMGTASASQTAGGCTPVTVARKDPFYNDVPLGSAQNLTFNLPAGTTVYSDAACSNGISSIALTAADVRATFHVRATVSAPAPGGTAMQSVQAILASQTATLTLSVSPAAATLAMTAPSGGMANVTANMACVTVSVERRDSFGNLVPVPGGTTSLTVTGSNAMAVYDSSNCGTSVLAQVPAMSGITAVPITAGSSQKTFSVRLTIAGSPATSVTLAGQTLPLALTVSPGPLTFLIIEGFVSPFTAGACSGALQVRRRDNFTNDIVNDPATMVAMTSPGFNFSGTATTCAGAAAGPYNINIPNGSAVSTTPFYVTTTVATAPAMTSITATSGSVSGMVSGIVNAATATQILFPTVPPSATAGICSAAFQVELRDQYNNLVRPASPVTVALGSMPVATAFGPSTCNNSAVQVTSAAPTANFVFSPITSGTNTITASTTTPALSAMTTINVNPGTPSVLAWRTNPPATPARFTCVPAGVIETRDSSGNLSNVTGANLTVNLVSTNTATTFFSDSNCMTPVTSTQVLMGTNETVPFYLFTTGGSADLTGTATGFMTTPSRNVNPGTNTGSFAVTPANPDVEAGACVALTVTRRDGSMTPFTTGTTNLTMSVPASQGITLHTASDCTGTGQASFARAINHGSDNFVIYARGRSASTGATPNDVTFTAQGTGSNDGTSTLKVYPLVRRGDCDLTAGNTLARCTLSPPIPGAVLTRSFLVFTSTGRPQTSSPNSITAGDQNVECHLEAPMTTADVVCTRATGSGSTNPVQINYQVVSFGRDAASTFGITVQHPPAVATSTTMATTTQTFTTPVDTSRSFILTSGTMNEALNNGEGFPLVRFSSPGASVNSIDIVSNTATPTARTVSFQVVTLGLASASVIHTTTPNPMTGGAQNNYTVTTASTPTNQSFVLAMAQVIDGTNPETMCRRRFNTRVTGATTFTMHRATATQPPACVDAQSTVTAFVSQRVNLGTTVSVQQVDVTFNNTSNATANSGTFTAIAPHRSITFLQTQGPGGQASGESNLTTAGQDGDDTAAFHATVEFNGNDRVTLTREVTGNTTSTFSPVVVQFDP
ncbi:MAG: putative metal-binding motif-containing protein [Archangium sp.]|nr:putative metal-binding motif-containing protein [Archangium sp.]